MATYTVCIRNHALKSGHWCGTFESPEAALTYARSEASRSRAFAEFEVWHGTPRKPICAVDGIPAIRGEC